MSDKSGIEWTEATWNPVTGCDRTSRWLRPLLRDDSREATQGHGIGEVPERTVTRVPRDQASTSRSIRRHSDVPFRWRYPRVVFVNSMSDLFHARVPLEFIRDVFDVCLDTPRHTYQVLTKRSLRLRRIAEQLDWPE